MEYALWNLEIIPSSDMLAAVAVAANPTAADLRSHLLLVREERARLLAYYDGDTQLLRQAAVLPESADTPLIARLALLVLGKKRRLVIGVAGSSVSAGHDSWHSAAWPAVLERLLAPTLRGIGAALEVRNQAVGGTNPFPASFCLGPMLGTDVDIVVREWEYWRYGDGLPAASLFAKQGANSEHAAVELFLRTALALPSQPAVHFLGLNDNGRSNARDAAMLKTWIHGGQSSGTAWSHDPNLSNDPTRRGSRSPWIPLALDPTRLDPTRLGSHSPWIPLAAVQDCLVAAG